MSLLKIYQTNKMIKTLDNGLTGGYRFQSHMGGGVLNTNYKHCPFVRAKHWSSI